MSRSRNTVLEALLGEYGFSHEALAEEVNRISGEIIGKPGNVSDRDIRRWVSGAVRWPTTRYLLSLTRIFNRPPEAMGFVPRGKSSRLPDLPPMPSRPDREEEPPVQRRTFLTATTGTTAAAIPLVATRPYAVGTTDVIRLRNDLNALTALDDAKGGHEALARSALAGATAALELQERAATQRIRQRLFSVAADYTATAAWSALDAHLLERAEAHLNRALYLAGMAKDSAMELQVWNIFAMLAYQRGDFTQAVSAAQAAQAAAITRRDPLHASLAFARTAVCCAAANDRQGALRSLGHAGEALNKVTPDMPRPRWLDFYDPAELSALSSIVHDRSGQPAEAEAASHRALAAIPQQFRRNRALATAQLATAQLHQLDVDQACVTAGEVFSLMGSDPLPGRIRSRLGDFHRDLITTAPDAPAAREWVDRHRDTWSRA
jgi:tetratricopeptide (TPR) repeat protein